MDHLRLTPQERQDIISSFARRAERRHSFYAALQARVQAKQEARPTPLGRRALSFLKRKVEHHATIQENALRLLAKEQGLN